MLLQGGRHLSAAPSDDVSHGLSSGVTTKDISPIRSNVTASHSKKNVESNKPSKRQDGGESL